MVSVTREEEFTFLLYIHTPLGVAPLSLYEEHNQYILLSWRDNLEPLAVVMAAIVSLGPLPYKLGEGAVMYSSQRVLRQMGYDQGAVSITRDDRSPLHMTRRLSS